MKRLIAIAITVACVAMLLGIVMPLGAGSQPGNVRAVFESDITRVPLVPGPPPIFDGNHPLENGNVYIREDGSYLVELTGAAPDYLYRVYMLHGPLCPPQAMMLGDIWTDSSGDFKLSGTLAPGGYAGVRITVLALGEPGTPAKYSNAIRIVP